MVPEPYNLTATFGNKTGIVDLMQGINTEVMKGSFGVMLLIAIFFISTMAFIRVTNDAKKSLAASSFITFVLSLILRALEVIPDFAVYVILGILAIIVAMSFKKD